MLATFLLGMFWKRATGHGAFWGLVCGSAAAAVHQGLSLPIDDAPGVHGGWITTLHLYPSQMAQNFWTAIFAWSTCFTVTVIVSLLTRAPDEAALVGLVRSLTPSPSHGDRPWWSRPAALGVVVLAGAVVLNLIYA